MSTIFVPCYSSFCISFSYSLRTSSKYKRPHGPVFLQDDCTTAKCKSSLVQKEGVSWDVVINPKKEASHSQVRRNGTFSCLSHPHPPLQHQDSTQHKPALLQRKPTFSKELVMEVGRAGEVPLRLISKLSCLTSLYNVSVHFEPYSPPPTRLWGQKHVSKILTANWDAAPEMPGKAHFPASGFSVSWNKVRKSLYEKTRKIY